MVAFTAQQVIDVFLQRWKIREFLQYVKPVSLLSSFKATEPLSDYKGKLIKFKERNGRLDRIG